MSTTWIQPDLLWTGAAFEPGLAVEVTPEGRVASVAPPPGAPTGARLERRAGEALLPGFVDVHSHAFQIGLRGHGERFPLERGSFWTWREAMYALVEGLTPEALRELSRRTFREMRRAGITAVGEFHYVHHADAAAADFALDAAVIEAAREAGIRLVLLQSYYRTGGPGRALEGGQRRFDGVSVERFLGHCDRVAASLDPARETMGLAPHSLRAVAPAELAALAAEAARRGWPLHLHLEEQRREIDECLAAYGRRPFVLALEALEALASPGSLAAPGAPGQGSPGHPLAVTGIHLTHTGGDALVDWFARGWTAGLCPLTEGNLGDGLPALADVPPPRRLALGGDSNLRVSMLENLRWLEYGQRLRTERRGLLGERPAVELLAAATAGGARSLALPAGALEPGRWADLVAVDLGHPALAGVAPERLPEALAFGAPDEVVLATAVGGRFETHRPRAA
jgi:formimidoylglutamate deiminase